LGENPCREGLKETPKRVAKMYEELLKGYKIDPKSVFKCFSSDHYSGLIVVSDIDFYSLCEHHLLPFYGKIHIGYVPDGKILGLSKFARLVEIFARRLQLQERLTKQIAETLQENLNSEGIVVYCEARHLCMSMRGIKKGASRMQTLVKTGVFNTNKNLLPQFFRQINLPGKIKQL
jgi:GTP cyclohydrolase I